MSNEALTMRELDMICDALFQRAADAATSREEDRWLSLRQKVGTMARAVEQTECRCGHARASHREDGRGKCVVCSCIVFTEGGSD